MGIQDRRSLPTGGRGRNVPDIAGYGAEAACWEHCRSGLAYLGLPRGHIYGARHRVRNCLKDGMMAQDIAPALARWTSPAIGGR